MSKQQNLLAFECTRMQTVVRRSSSLTGLNYKLWNGLSVCRLTVLFIVGGTLIINRKRRNGMRKEKRRAPAVNHPAGGEIRSTICIFRSDRCIRWFICSAVLDWHREIALNLQLEIALHNVFGRNLNEHWSATWHYRLLARAICVGCKSALLIFRQSLWKLLDLAKLSTGWSTFLHPIIVAVMHEKRTRLLLRADS